MSEQPIPFPGQVRGLVVTGTDTGVGKTVVSAVLCRLLDAVYVKPVQSGAADGDDDAALVAAVADVPTVVGAVFEESLAPSMAARRDGQILERGQLTGVVRTAAAVHEGKALVVEGAGGILVHLGTDGTTLADLALDLHLPMVIVARPGLGTLNHTLLTLEAAERREIPVLGVVIAGMPQEQDLATATNVEELQELTDGMVVGVMPRLDVTRPLPDLDTVRSWVGPGLGGTWMPV